ncbi:MAG: TonB-dependent receptor [Pseudomonadota bacterium]
MLALVVGTQVYAQEDNTQGSTRLQRIVKGAGEHKVAVDTPQAVTVANQTDLEEAQPTTSGDVFKQIPGANTSGSERVLGESFNIRGIGPGEDQADEGRVIVSVDGVDKNYQQYRLGGFFSDPELFKRVEVLRGPASSTLYGSGALAGIVQFTTKDAVDFLDDGEKVALRLKSTFDSNSSGLLGSAILAWMPSESFEFLAAGNHRQGWDYTSGNGTVVDADFIAKSALLKGAFHFGENNEQTIKASLQRWQTEAENQQYAQTVNSPGFGRVDRSVRDETYLVSYENPASSNDWVDIKIQASYSNTFNQERNATTFNIRGRPVQFFPDADFQYETWQAKAQNTVKAAGENWENYFTVGTQFTHLERSLALRNTGAQPEGTDQKFGVFAQSEFTYNEKLTIIPGVRIDHRRLTPDASVVAGFAGGAETDTDVAFSPKVAALYKFTDSFNIFGSYAHTQRFPTLDEVYDYRTGFIPGTNLKKERSNNFEVGFGVSQFDLLESGDAFQFKTTVFHNTIHDYIYRSPVARTANARAGRPTAGPGSAFVNIGDVRLYGIEIETAYSAEYWFASAGASIIRGQDINNSLPSSGHLNTVPADELFVTAGLKVPDHGFSFGWKGRFVADQNQVFGTPVGRLAASRRPSNGFHTHGLFLNWVPEKGLGSTGVNRKPVQRSVSGIPRQRPGTGQNIQILYRQEIWIRGITDENRAQGHWISFSYAISMCSGFSRVGWLIAVRVSRPDP